MSTYTTHCTPARIVMEDISVLNTSAVFPQIKANLHVHGPTHPYTMAIVSMCATTCIQVTHIGALASTKTKGGVLTTSKAFLSLLLCDRI